MGLRPRKHVIKLLEAKADWEPWGAQRASPKYDSKARHFLAFLHALFSNLPPLLRSRTSRVSVSFSEPTIIWNGFSVFLDAPLRTPQRATCWEIGF